MLCGVCVWHAIVGAAAVHYLDRATSTPEVAPLPDVTSSTPSNATDESTVCPSAIPPEIAEIVMADKMALAVFGALYVLFHVILVVRSCTSVSTTQRRCVINLLLLFITYLVDSTKCRQSLSLAPAHSSDEAMYWVALKVNHCRIWARNHIESY